MKELDEIIDTDRDYDGKFTLSWLATSILFDHCGEVRARMNMPYPFTYTREVLENTKKTSLKLQAWSKFDIEDVRRLADVQRQSNGETQQFEFQYKYRSKVDVYRLRKWISRKEDRWLGMIYLRL